MTTGLRPADLVVLNEVRRQTSEGGYCALSTRRFYELTGIGRKTIQRSLSRLAEAGLVRRVRASQGGAAAHWAGLRVEGLWPESNACRDTSSTGVEAETVDCISSSLSVALIDPGKGNRNIIPDAFRRSDLRSPWLLYLTLPFLPLTLNEVVAVSGLTARKRTAEWWLLILASLVPPLVDASSAERDCKWTKLPVDEGKLDRLEAHLEALASTGRGRQLHTAQRAQLKNQLERESNLLRREVRYGY